ncbi:cytochrome c oxidase subunit 8A, mitochondrial [Paramisgurnus dabryanus]|uniref:cytochrome c oxidase subunit 8A, mitochondrial n=1 Tax=Paramisgurnus dabryanus TaxID=90735 RepID=UPI0031F3950F
MSGFLRAISRIRAAPVLRAPTISQRANITSRPAKGTVGTTETVVGLTLFSLAVLGPAGWVLANLENYKKRDTAE